MDLGFIGDTQSGIGQLAGCAVPFLGLASLGKITAGMIGVLVVGAIIMLVGRGMKAKA